MPYRFDLRAALTGCSTSASLLMDWGRLWRGHADGKSAGSNVGVSSELCDRVGELLTDAISGQ